MKMRREGPSILIYASIDCAAEAINEARAGNVCGDRELALLSDMILFNQRPYGEFQEFERAT
jgi:hypothetical protein